MKEGCLTVLRKDGEMKINGYRCLSLRIISMHPFFHSEAESRSTGESERGLAVTPILPALANAQIIQYIDYLHYFGFAFFISRKKSEIRRAENFT